MRKTKPRLALWMFSLVVFGITLGSAPLAQAQGSGTVLVINSDPFAAPPSILSSVLVQAGPEGLAVAPDGTRLYCTNEASDSISVIDTTDLSVSTITQNVGQTPEKIAFRLDGKRAYFTDECTADVRVIDTDRLDVGQYNHTRASSQSWSPASL